MAPWTVTRQMLAFQNQAGNAFQSMWDLAQTQTSSTVDRLMGQAAWMPRESRQAIENW